MIERGLIRLSVRSTYGRRGVADRPDKSLRYVTEFALPKLLLLIHGFANDEPKASESYGRFVANLRDAVARLGSEMDWPVVAFHWPGDYPEHALISAMTYPARIPVAADSGRLLADFLHDHEYMKETNQVFVVAHSLGCRVALELLHDIDSRWSYGGPRIAGLALLAAAVSSEDCKPDGVFKEVQGHAAGVAFYSRNDKALIGPVFGAGQQIFGERGKAVGRFGTPDERWKPSIEMTLQHKQYWGEPLIAKHVAAILGFGDFPLPENTLAEDVLDSRDDSEPRELAAREIGSTRS